MKRYILCIAAVLAVPALSGTADANKALVEIVEPVRFSDTGRATVTCRVSHSGNNFIHHTSRLRVTSNGKQAGQWDFTWRNLPEEEDFMRDVAIDAAGPVIIEAEANCNIHGSRGLAQITLVPPNKK